ncbi:MAG: hypothetical protein V2I63_02325 [Pseudomonadales bacterium]|jgi:hypothetical protein|nr:hypothetical protein [Pseudomonadales bacterium]
MTASPTRTGRFRRRTLSGLLALLLAPFAQGAERQVEDSLGPLAHLVGHWQVLTSIPGEGGLQVGPPGKAVILPILGGQALVEDVTLRFPDAEGLRLRHTFTHDPYVDLFRITAIDDASGLLDVYEGRFEDGRLQVDNIRAHTFSPTALGRELAFRLRWHEISADGFRFDVFQSDDGGESWALYAAQTYLRDSDPADAAGDAPD